jgi:selenocysteine lyase/cysteine desulfurase
LHKYNALAFWDYASAAPYVKIDMNPLVDGPYRSLAYKDAIFISPHKFIGGVGTPGILLAKKRLFSEKPSSCPGGGRLDSNY